MRDHRTCSKPWSCLRLWGFSFVHLIYGLIRHTRHGLSYGLEPLQIRPDQGVGQGQHHARANARPIALKYHPHPLALANALVWPDSLRQSRPINLAITIWATRLQLFNLGSTRVIRPGRPMEITSLILQRTRRTRRLDTDRLII